MANSYSINHRTWKWTKKLFFHLFDLAILNSYILFSSLGGKKISHSDFRNTVLANLLAHAGHERNVQRPIGRPLAVATQFVRFEERGGKHWPIPSATQRCRACVCVCVCVCGKGCHQKCFSDMRKV